MHFTSEGRCNEVVKAAVMPHKDAVYELARSVIGLCNDDTDVDLVAAGIVECLCETVWYNSDEEPDPDMADMRARAEYENVYVDMAKEHGLF